MAQVQLPINLMRVLRTCLVLSAIGVFATIMMGNALVKTNDENKIIKKFIEISKNASINFEDSLLAYTEKTRETISYLLNLRPRMEEDVINFISKIEKIGQELSLNVKLETYEDPLVTKKGSKIKAEEVITYKVSFFGSSSDLYDFLSELESLPYFIKVSNVNFKNPNYMEKTEDIQPNINLTIKLYTKNNATGGS
ncbi:MAG: hypothetical protein WC285_03255 [Candidatus Gracilibacteria bacterium]|jgi:Tfp pilus assembly protein PilO